LTVSENKGPEEVRQFITKFFQTVRNSTWTIADDCLAGASDPIMEKVITALSASDVIATLMSLRELSQFLYTVCPIEDFHSIENETIAAFESGAMFSNIIKNLYEIKKLVDGAEIDRALFVGKLYNLVIVGKATHSKFLALPSRQMSTQDAKDFLLGFLQGTSDVPIEQNQCINGSKAFLPDLIAALNGIFQAIANKTGIKDAFVAFMLQAMQLQNVEASCHFVSLASQFVTLTNPLVIAKISWRITKNLSKVIGHIKDAVSSSKGGDMRGSGSHVGGIFQIIFEYHSQ
jgi:hypothetical protein